MCPSHYWSVVVDPQGDSRVDPQTTLYFNVVNNRADPWKTDNFFCKIKDVSVHTHHIDYESTCPSAYQQWKLANECVRIAQFLLRPSKLPYRMLETNTSVQAKCFTLSGSYFILQLSYAWMSSWVRTFSIALWVYIAFSHKNICKRGNNNYTTTWQSSKTSTTLNFPDDHSRHLLQGFSVPS